MNFTGLFGRRSVLKAGALLGGLSALPSRAALADAQERNDSSAREAVADEARMADIPLNSSAKVTVERRGQIVLIGINRPYIHNRVDPETYAGLAMAYYQYDHDPSLQAAVLFGHGDNFSRGIDVDAFAAIVTSSRPHGDGYLLRARRERPRRRAAEQRDEVAPPHVALSPAIAAPTAVLAKQGPSPLRGFNVPRGRGKRFAKLASRSKSF
jgi:hypothetical protein